VYLEDSNLLLLPISPSAMELIAEMNLDDGTPRHTGLKVKTPQWETRSSVEAVLTPLYVVNVDKIGELLLELGRKLGAFPSEKPGSFLSAQDSEGTQVKVPVASREQDGWILMTLTRCRFPTICCVCLIPTLDTHEFSCANFLGGRFLLRLPTCKGCGYRFGKTKERFILSGFALALALGITFLVFWDPRKPWLTWVFVVLVAGTLFATWFFANLFFHMPVKVRYSSEKGTLRLRFYNREFEEMVLALRD
jgi:hypothetical protein